MSLALRLNLMVAVALLLMLTGAASLILTNARESVAEETDSAITLTLQLLEALSGSSAEAPSSTDAGPYDDAVISTLLDRVARLRDVRHVDIGLVRQDGMHPFSPSSLAPDMIKAPLWFVRLMAPEPVEYRYQLALQGRRIGIALRPSPGDEIDEAWEESRATFTLLLVFALVVMVLTWWISYRALRPVGHVLTALDRLEQGDYATRLQRFDLPELQRISDRLNHVASTLDHQEQENRALSQQAMAIQEAERSHLARELHDELGQSISAIKALAVSVRQRSNGQEAVAERASTICEVSDQMYSVVRRLMGELRPQILDDLGLRASLEKLVDDWGDRHGTVACDLQLEGDLDALHEDVTIKIYRIVQEGLTNVARHAQATRAQVTVALSRHEQVLRVTVSDNGVGMRVPAPRSGLGLLGIRERIASLDGDLSVNASARGTQLHAEVPLAKVLEPPYAKAGTAASGTSEQQISPA